MIDWQYSVKRDLQEYADKCDAVAGMREELAAMDAALTGISSPMKGNTPVQGSADASDKWLNMIVRRDEMAISLANTEARVKRIHDGLEGLSEDELLLLDRMYIHHIPFNHICELMHLEQAQVYRLLKNAIRRLAVRMYGDSV